MRSPLLSVAVVGGFYLLLIDTTSLPELYAGAAATALGAACWQAVRRSGEIRMSPRVPWLLRSFAVVAKIPADTARVSFAAVDQLVRPRKRRGVLRAVPFPDVSPDAHGEARRALAEALGSLTPNTIVIGVDQERGLLLAHQLRRTGEPRSLDVTQPRG
jgi:multisubunit Na+/H+ antiporter MnhE subunit